MTPRLLKESSGWQNHSNIVAHPGFNNPELLDNLYHYNKVNSQFGFRGYNQTMTCRYVYQEIQTLNMGQNYLLPAPSSSSLP